MRHDFPQFNLIAHIAEQRAWSNRTFGPMEHRGTDGVIDHLRKEIEEVAASPDDLEEWIDVIMLAIDGALRSGNSPVQIADMLGLKLEKNQNREWPDWRTQPAGKAIEHVNVS